MSVTLWDLHRDLKFLSHSKMFTAPANTGNQYETIIFIPKLWNHIISCYCAPEKQGQLILDSLLHHSRGNLNLPEQNRTEQETNLNRSNEEKCVCV